MHALTPIERAVATYCSEWGRAKADEETFSKVNAETLGNATPPDFQFRYIDIASVSRGTIDWTAVVRICFADSPSRARRVVRHGDTMICTVRPLLESHTYAGWTNDESTVCSTGFAVLRPAGVIPDFLKHLPFTEQVRQQLVAWQCGTNYPAVNERDIRKLVFPFPPADEQAAIARALNAFDTALERVRAATIRARDVKRALAQELFSKGTRNERQKKTVLGYIPHSWTVVPVESVVTEFQYGLSVPMQLKGAIPILRMGNIQSGDVVFNELKYVSLPEQVIAPYIVKKGDVLFNRTNSQEWVGKVGIYRLDAPVVFASYLIRVVPDSKQVDNYFLGQLLDSYPIQCRIKRYATPGVQQVNINATNLGKVLIPLPTGETSLEEQREIAAILEAADAVIRNYEPVLVAQQALKKSLMHDLLTGHVRVPIEQSSSAADNTFSGKTKTTGRLSSLPA
jgi:type I restriction enzyme S subunit